MKSQRSSSMYRSGTMPISLPKISKLNVKQSRYESNRQNRSSFGINLSKARNSKSFMESAKSPYTTRVQNQILDEQEYPYIETSNIEKQHLRLKDLLKEFNEQTVTILQKYVIDRPIRKQYTKKKQPIQSIIHVRDKQAQNSNYMIGLLKTEIDKLQSRCQNLKYMSKEQFQLRIRELKEEKQKIIMENKEISRQITLNGLQMVRGKQSLTKELEYDQFLIDTKRDRLKKQSQSVTTQIASLQQKTKQINQQIQKYEQQESYTLKQFQQIQRQKTQNRLYQQLSKKRKILEHNKVMNQSTNYQLKHKYFQKLKQLEDYSNKEEQFESKMQSFEAMIEKARQSIKQLQKKENETGSKIKFNVGPQMLTSKTNYGQITSAKINLNLS